MPLFDKWSSGILKVSDLWMQYNPHRPFFPEIAYLWLGNITNYNTIAEMYLIQACLVGTLLILLLAFIDNRVSTQSSRLLLFVPVSLLIFSLIQYKNILFGYQIEFAFAQMFGVLALFLLYILGHRSSFGGLTFVAALMSATVASYSVLQGLFVWPAGLAQLGLGPLARRKKGVFVALWGLVGIAEWVAFFIGWVGPGESTLLYALEHPLQEMHYYMKLLGSALFWQPNTALVGGLLLVCLALVGLIVLVKDGKMGDHSFWISLLLYSLLTLGAITVGRASWGVDQAVHAKRYVTFPILAVVGIYVMLAKMALERRVVTDTLLLVAISGTILISAFISYPRGFDKGERWKEHMEEEAFILSTYQSQPAAALRGTPSIDGATVKEELAPILDRLDYSVFSEQSRAPSSSPPGGCSVKEQAITEEYPHYADPQSDSSPLQGSCDVRYTTDASVEGVLGYYEKLLRRDGWEVIGTLAYYYPGGIEAWGQRPPKEVQGRRRMSELSEASESADGTLVAHLVARRNGYDYYVRYEAPNKKSPDFPDSKARVTVTAYDYPLPASHF